jgi:uncharacterized protein (TIGR02118 family)
VKKIVALMSRRDGMDSQEFDRHWREEHPRYVRALPGIRRYVQSPAFEHRPQWPYDGLSELWFDSLKGIAIAFASPAAEPMREDEKRFIGKIEWFIVDEDEMREVELRAETNAPSS